MLQRSILQLNALLRINTIVYSPLLHRKASKEAIVKIDKPFKLFMLETGPDIKATLTREEALEYYKQMFTIRRLEQKCADFYKAKVIRGFCHLYSGQEAISVGMKGAMREQDTLITSYRCHAWTYLLGVSCEGIMAELAGRLTGCSRGKGGSMHMFSKNFLGGNGIVGAQVPLGVGSAFAHKYKNTKGVCFILYGDGAANQGQIFEAFNLAKLYNLPAVFVCENNKYGMGTADYRAAASPEFYKRGCYIPGILVDGMDLIAVREATRFAVAHIIAGKGPLILEQETYRYFGHSMSDPGTSYRSREEVQDVRKTRDPISRFKETIVKGKLVSEQEIKDIDKGINNSISEAEKKVLKAPFPPMEELTTDIYLKFLEKEIRNIAPFMSLPHKNIGKPYISP